MTFNPTSSILDDLKKKHGDFSKGVYKGPSTVGKDVRPEISGEHESVYDKLMARRGKRINSVEQKPRTEKQLELDKKWNAMMMAGQDKEPSSTAENIIGGVSEGALNIGMPGALGVSALKNLPKVSPAAYALSSIPGLAKEGYGKVLESFGIPTDVFKDELEQTPSLPGQEVRHGQQSQALERLSQGNQSERGFFDILSDVSSLDSEDDISPIYGRMPDMGLYSKNAIPRLGDENSVARQLSSRVIGSSPLAAAGPAALGGALLGDIAGLGAKELAEYAGLPGWVQTGADILAGLSTGIGSEKGLSALARKAKSQPQTPGQIARKLSKEEQAAANVLREVPPESSVNLQSKKIADLPKEKVQDFEKKIGQMEVEPLAKPFEADFHKKQLVDDVKTSILNKVSPEEVDAKKTWEEVQKSLRETLQAEKKQAQRLYSDAKTESRDIKFSPMATIRKMNSIYKQLGSSAVHGGSQGTVKNVLAQARKHIAESVKSENGYSIEEGINLLSRLGEYVDYQSLEPKVINLIKTVRGTLKEEIKNALSKSGNKAAEKAYLEAEAQATRTGKRFYDSKAVMHAMKSQAPEDLPSRLAKPSYFEDLLQVVPERLVPKLEKSILQEAEKKGPKSISKVSEELSPFMTPVGRKAGKSLSDLGSSLSQVGARRAFTEKVLESTQEAVANGQKPKMLMNAMQTPEGYEISKKAMSSSENGKKIFDNARDMLINETIMSFLDESGKISTAKLNKALQNKAFVRMVEEKGGKDAVGILRNIEGLQENSQKMASYIESHSQSLGKAKKTPLVKRGAATRGESLLKRAGEKVTPPAAPEMPKNKWEEMVDSLGNYTKGALMIMMGEQLGSKSAATSVVAMKALGYLLTRPKAKSLIRGLSNTLKGKPSPETARQFLNTIQKLDEVLR